MGRLPVIIFFGLILTMSEYSCDDNPVNDISILILQITYVSRMKSAISQVCGELLNCCVEH